MELLASLPPSTEQVLRKELATIEAVWEKLRQESPTLPTIDGRESRKI
jgi:hypothetical protein